MDVRERLAGCRGRPPRRLLRTLRRPSSPRGARWPSTSTCSAPCGRRASPGDRGPPARRGFDSRPASSTRCWPTSRASPARSRCSRTRSTSRGLAATGGSSRARATVDAGGVRGAIATRRRRSSWAAARGAGAHAADVPPAHRAGRDDGGHPQAGPAGGAGPEGERVRRPRCSSSSRPPGSWSSATTRPRSRTRR